MTLAVFLGSNDTKGATSRSLRGNIWCVGTSGEDSGPGLEHHLSSKSPGLALDLFMDLNVIWMRFYPFSFAGFFWVFLVRTPLFRSSKRSHFGPLTSSDGRGQDGSRLLLSGALEMKNQGGFHGLMVIFVVDL